MRTIWVQYDSQAYATHDGVRVDNNSSHSVECFLFFVFRCFFGSLAPYGCLRSFAPEGSVILGQALPPCGVESEPYALPESCAAWSKPGALCGYF